MIGSVGAFIGGIFVGIGVFMIILLLVLWETGIWEEMAQRRKGRTL